MVLVDAENQTLNGGLFWEKEPVSMSEPRRITLPASIRKKLKMTNITELWRFNAFEFKGIVLCPPQNILHYVEMVEKKLLQDKENPPPLKDTRKYSYPYGDAQHIDSQGRITLSDPLIRHAGIDKNVSMTIIGARLWYEIWFDEDLDN